MSNNKKAYNIHQLAGKHYTKFSPLLKHMQHLQIYWKIINLSKYSKYVEELLINMSHFYIHYGLLWKTPLFLTLLILTFMVIHNLTAICGLHCCLVGPSVKEMLERLCKLINSHERCRMSLDNVISCNYHIYIYQKENNTKSSCIINLSIIYLLKNSLIERGNLSKGGREGL
jgi:hypothetical protein